MQNPKEGKEPRFVILDSEDHEHFYEGTKLQCGWWLFQRYINQDGEFTIIPRSQYIEGMYPLLESGEEEFQLPEHCANQKAIWVLRQRYRSVQAYCTLVHLKIPPIEHYFPEIKNLK